jgi:prolipoprotein diacylglyceryltransferase
LHFPAPTGTSILT